MEHRDQEKDMGLPNSSSYNQESLSSAAATLSTAPIVSRNENIGHGNTILSPNQTLDQHNFIQPPHVNSNPEGANIQNSGPDLVRQQSTNSVTDRSSSSSVRYRECLKNHAATMGGHVLDGCGEFMPSGEKGTTEYLKCAACDCHRNFHRRETEDESQTPGVRRNDNNNSHRVHTQPPPSHPPAPPLQHHNKFSHSYPRGPMPPVMMNFGGNTTGAAAESSSEDLNMFHGNAGGIIQPSNYSGSKKRFRTKFTQQQKDRMSEFAEKLGWRIQKQDEQEVQQFCNEVGVKRQVFKVWMHNSKQAIKRKQT